MRKPFNISCFLQPLTAVMINARLLLLLLAVMACQVKTGFGQPASTPVPVITHARHITVAADGSGDYLTIKSAIDKNTSNEASPLIIYVKAGIYKEKLIFDSTLSYVKLIGEGALNTVITFDDYAGKPGTWGPHTTRSSYTSLVAADHFYAYNISFVNSAGTEAGQAVAVEITGDKVLFLNCRFLGNQDVLYIAATTSRCYFEHCYIEGTTDFIFGAGTAWFEKCNIYSKKNSYITAASTPKEHTFGFVFNRCKLFADPAVRQVSLGRPWRDYGAVAFIHSYLGGQIIAEGWSNWKGTGRDKTARFSEFKNTGPGASTNPSRRLPWTNQLSEKAAVTYRVKNVLSDWQPDIKGILKEYKHCSQ